MPQADSAPEEEARQVLGEETDLGGGAVRAMWRWTCFQVSFLPGRTVEELGLRSTIAFSFPSSARSPMGDL